MDILLSAHSGLRWLVLLLAVIVLVKFLLGWLQNQSFQAIDGTLLRAYTISFDIQVLLGIIFLLWNGLGAGTGFPRHRLEHAGIMLVGVAVVHMTAMWKKSPAQTRFRNSFLAVVVSLLLVIAGISGLPQGWS